MERLWRVIERESGESVPEGLAVEFTELGDAMMYAAELAKAFATLYGDPNANPVVVLETPTRWRVLTPYMHTRDHVVEVVEASDVSV